MSELGEFWRDIDEANKFERHGRVAQASSEFSGAAKLAFENGLVLRFCSTAHYQLFPKAKRRSWLINLYPGNQRVYGDPNRRGPYLELPEPWRLEDAVRAAIGATSEHQADYQSDSPVLPSVKTYRYVLMYRPATACRLPDGWTLVERGNTGEYPLRVDLPTGRTMFGVVAWERSLSEEECNQFELCEWEEWHA